MTAVASLVAFVAVCGAACWQAGQAGHPVWSVAFALAGGIGLAGIGWIYAGGEES